MKQKLIDHLEQVLHHLYINPLEKCNLRCKICYTRKTDPILSQEQILEFIDRYKKYTELQTVTFCGGEVFALQYFPALINTLTNQGIFVQIITNGTIDKLNQFTNPNFVNLIVSIDGLQEYHDSNRGHGNFDKSVAFLKKAMKSGFHTEIFSIITKQNLIQLNEFEKYVKDELAGIPITYHPRKPPAYLTHHPISNIVGEVEGFDFLSDEEMIQVMKEKNVFPPKNLGCYQIAVASDGKIYGCCEGTVAIGTIDDTIDHLVQQMKVRLGMWEKMNTFHNCLGCTQAEFMCGIKKHLDLLHN